MTEINNQPKRSPFEEYLKEIIYGGNDGIVTTFAVVSGFSGAAIQGDEMFTLTFGAVLLFGFANLFADGLSMGLGNFLSIRAEKDQYRSAKEIERREIESEVEKEEKETISILKNKGFEEEDAKSLVQIYKKNKKYWVDWMMHNDLELPNPENINPVYTGLATFLSFLFFGLIPLLPYSFIEGTPLFMFLVSSAGTFFALVLLGILRWKIIGDRFLRSVSEIVLIGGTAAVTAFVVGFMFKG